MFSIFILKLHHVFYIYIKNASCFLEKNQHWKVHSDENGIKRDLGVWKPDKWQTNNKNEIKAIPILGSGGEGGVS